MKVTGIIAEYNPFHNGHKYHMEQARAITEADYVIAVMSGDFVQRGAPAIYNKYLRTRTALLSGADLVLEMPVFGSVSSAEDFALCGVSMLAHTGIVTHLCFGSETGNTERLKQAAALYDTETEDISEKVRKGLKAGLTWPRARELAFADAASGTGTDAVSVLSSSPNDILGCEYIRAISRLKAPMEPVTIKRTDPGYHSKERDGAFASATAARKAILEGDFSFLEKTLPEAFFSCLTEENCPPVCPDDFSMLMGDRILSSSLNDLQKVSGMPDDLAAKIYKNRNTFYRTGDLIRASKDRQYTYARVSRCLLNLMLGISKEETAVFKSMDSAPWLRILGFRADAGPLLSALKKNASAPVLTKTAHASRILGDDALNLFEKHVLSADRYRMTAELKTGRSTKNEYTRSPIIL